MSATRHHPIFWAMIGIPAAAVLASFYTLYLAMSGSEPELPPQYVSEGAALDADFARAQRAIDAGITVNIDWLRQQQPAAIEATYASTSGIATPASLKVRMTHATLPALDQEITLARLEGTNRYRAQIHSIPEGNWLLEVSAEDWRLRGRIDSSNGIVALGAMDGD
jgi:hypothetical protein